MNPDLERLQPYPFERLAELKAGVVPRTDASHIALSIGEPQHPTPHFLTEAYISHAHGLGRYAATGGTPELRQAICDWLSRRFEIPGNALDPDRHVLPVNGTREALFAAAQAIVDRDRNAAVVMPNPFYQIYEGAALLAGAQPVYLNTPRNDAFLPDPDALATDVWERCQLVYLCSPGNPTGAVMPLERWRRLLELADRHDFVIASDECYSEIYPEESQPPLGLLQACRELGRDDFARCLVFHSLSKRSNAPGLRSGFVAGDASILRRFLLYRTYHGCAMPLQTQWASISAWNDEAHVRHNRQLYREKFATVADILGPVLEFDLPGAGFYLWPRTPIDDEAFARGLFEAENVTVLPGSYLSRECDGVNPGRRHVRIALVAEPRECAEAALRIRRFVEAL
ncbi:MAG: succinyldiaminopimelate transaminase [Ectothiorhodospiraceae bacterium]|jgi:N-succinyldiaminopimelate aminotransferase